MKKIFSLAAKLPGLFDVRDAFLFSGLALSSYGLSLVYLPLAFIAPGAVLTYLAIAANGGGNGER